MLGALLPNYDSDQVHDEGLLDLIIERVSELLETDPGLLFSYMYRLDVEESKLKMAINLNTGERQIRALAQLIFDRQKLRMIYKKKYAQGQNENDI